MNWMCRKVRGILGVGLLLGACNMHRIFGLNLARHRHGEFVHLHWDRVVHGCVGVDPCVN